MGNRAELKDARDISSDNTRGQGEYYQIFSIDKQETRRMRKYEFWYWVRRVVNDSTENKKFSK